MSEFHCRVYGAHGEEAQSTHLHVEADRLCLTDSAYSNYQLPFTNLSMELVGSGPVCVQFKVLDQELTIVSTDIDVLNEVAVKAAGTEMGERAVSLKRKLVREHTTNRKKWMIVAAIFLGFPIVFLILLNCGINYFIAQLNPQYEARLGEWIAESEKSRSIETDSKRVETIGKKLVKELSKPPYPFKFFVEKDDEINACAYPGGVIVVNSALLEQADDDELAGVLGHEIGHGLHRDTLRATLHDMGAGLSFSVFMHMMGLGGLGGLTGQHMAQLMQNLQAMSFSRGQEAAADQEGVRLAMKAGYSGEGLLKFFEKQKAKHGKEDVITSELTGLFSTHPLDEDRIVAIRAEIAKVKAEEKHRH